LEDTAVTSPQWAWTGIAALLVFWAVGAYNRLVRLKNAIANAFGPLDVLLKRRHDAIVSLVQAIDAHTPLPDPALTGALMQAQKLARNASDAMRSRPTQVKTVRTLAAAEAALTHCLLALLPLIPPLTPPASLVKAGNALLADNTITPTLTVPPVTIAALLDELGSTDSAVQFARQTYNAAVTDYNSAQGEFPVLVLARLCGFGPLALLTTTTDRADRAGTPEETRTPDA
jgi:LemA protein